MQENYCRDGKHSWEETPSNSEDPEVYQCTKCTANARRMDGRMILIVCSHMGCLNPAWRIQEDQVWVCDGHWTGVLVA